jgi:hypothetical protein
VSFAKPRSPVFCPDDRRLKGLARIVPFLTCIAFQQLGEAEWLVNAVVVRNSDGFGAVNGGKAMLLREE